MRVLLVQPSYYTQFPPLPLLKFATYHRERGDEIRLVYGTDSSWTPNLIYITSLFTYYWRTTIKTVSFYRNAFPRAHIKVGGIYASLCPDDFLSRFPDIELVKGVVGEVEDLMPAYDLIPDYKWSLLFSSRGCIRKCQFCPVSVLEPEFKAKKDISHLVHPNHTGVVFFDNNFLASPYWKEIIEFLLDRNLKVDFNQGLDARIMTEEQAYYLSKLKIDRYRLAADHISYLDKTIKAVNMLKNFGVRPRKIMIYCLYNSDMPGDTPQNFFLRIKELLKLDVAIYPMRFEPLVLENRKDYISPYWDSRSLRAVNEAIARWGYHGTLYPNYPFNVQIDKFDTFEEAFPLTTEIYAFLRIKDNGEVRRSLFEEGGGTDDIQSSDLFK